MNSYSAAELAELLDSRESGWAATAMPMIGKWIERGDGAAVYENHDLGHPELGDVKVVSFGSPAAQIEAAEPPQRLPDIGGAINWRYTLIGTYGPKEE